MVRIVRSNFVMFAIISSVGRTLEEPVHLKDDVFSVRYDITVPKEIFTEPIQLFVTVPPSDVHHHLGRFLLAGDGADITFKVDGETFAAHRRVLAARSCVFTAELFGPMREKTTTCVHIKDMEAKVFKAMLHFIYSDSLPHIDDANSIGMAQHLLVAADRYNLERLKLICVQKLCNNMDTSMAATTLALAKQHGCRGLKEKLCNNMDTSMAATTLALAEHHGCRGLKEVCFKFLGSAGNILKAVMVSDGFEHLRSSCPSVLKELLAKLAP
ncbi:BTB/POZ and MATH domain-containing protein 1-like [Aegilops tauschii subsp. strangulata]|uniref:BTB/POZ and MATH domain-containing protein 1-like n=1 Tax=Aegilops tauschii subsp. strangulata TaxID=200361 RepID=UPI003CC88913